VISFSVITACIPGFKAFLLILQNGLSDPSTRPTSDAWALPSCNDNDGPDVEAGPGQTGLKSKKALNSLARES